MPNPEILSDFTPIMKNVYLPFRKKLFPMLTPLLAQARRGGPKRVKYGGNDLFFDVKVERRGGFVASSGGYFPDSKTAREKQGRLSIARTYVKVFVDGLALKATANKKSAYISAAAKSTEDVMDDWKLEQNRILHGDSLAIRATIGTVTSTTIVVAANPYGISGSGPGNLHLVAGETISVLSSDGATHRGKTTISTIVLSGDDATITYSAAVAGQQVGDLIVTAPPAATHATDNSWGAEPFGLKAIVDVENAFATFEGISDARWVAQKLTDTSVDELILMRLLNTIRARSGADWRADPRNLLLLTTTGIWQTYGNSMLGMRRYAAPTLKLKGGFTGVQVGNAVLIDDPWCPRGRVYAIHTPDTMFIDLMDFGHLNFQDTPTWRLAQTRDGYETVFGAYWNYGVTARASHGVLSGVTDTVNYSPVF